MELAFAATDLVVARAGAATVSELTALGLPAVYRAAAVGNGEQRLNARDVVAGGRRADRRERPVHARLDFGTSSCHCCQDRALLADMAARAAPSPCTTAPTGPSTLIREALGGVEPDAQGR